MNVRKFVAANSRLAMRQVKLELGEDAVILSTRQVAEGLEIMAVALADMASLHGADDSNASGPSGAPAGAARAAAPQPAAALTLQSFVDFARKKNDGDALRSDPAAAEAAQRAASSPSAYRAAAMPSGPRATPAFARPAAAAPAPAASPALRTAEPAPDELMSELRSMRSLMEAQLASLAWSDSARRAPLKTKLASLMLAAGFSPGLCRAVAARLPDDYTAAQADSWLASIVEANVRKAAADELINKGGVYALVGPTGVGKTTTTAKLAARYVMKYGAQRLGLISADSYRIGAQDQLRIYGRILGVPVHAVQDANELHATLAAMRDKHLVLIDTIGVGQRDERVAEQVVMLGAPGVKRLLMLNAAAQGETLEDVVQAYAGSNAAGSNAAGSNAGNQPAGNRLAGCCISKLDEAVKPGTVLDTAIRHKLPLHYVSTGQRVPEDLHLPNVTGLVQAALKRATSDAFRLTQDEAGLLLAPNFAAPGVAPAAAVHGAR
jgi:flagellar biosynthesis protein FlhF